MKTESECILGTCVGINKEHSNGLGKDLIERQAVIRKLKKMATQAYIDKLNGSAETVINCCIDVIERQIPSAQPEIIHCRDCKYWQDQQEGVIEVPICARSESKYEKLPFRFMIGEDGFCSYAERRTDDSIPD